ncbi:MAG: phage terminase large subunit family protein, partial [Gemmataceae bacterium]|nr:phage terminase large subunit family protein [Gemmataceae bacterium]
TALCIADCLWATLCGHQPFVCLIGASEAHAEEMLDAIKSELECNELLDQDFSEVTGPVRALEGIANRCKGQLYVGERTHILWTAKSIVLPVLPHSKAAGAVVRVTGITGRIRGMSFKRSDGKTVRPSLVVIDDPQTDESARSPSQVAERERVLAGAVLGMAGPGKKISGILPCTVIRPTDMADSILDRDKHPEWNGERTRMVYAFPTETKLWDRYGELRAESYRGGRRGEEATEFYRVHRQAMDEGAAVAWPERFNQDELSAVQHAMNLRLLSETAFWAEYQNSPLPEDSGGIEELTADQIAAKVNRLRKGEVPLAATRLTAFIDVQEKLLYYVVCAWADDFTGAVIDYGAYPDQRRQYFTLRDARHTLRVAAPGAGLEGSIFAGLERLCGAILGREWWRDDGSMLRVERCLIDANWGASTNVVYDFCRRSPCAAVLTPFHGKGVTASSQPFGEYKPKPGDRVGLNWRILAAQGRRVLRRCFADVNWWKSFVHARLAVAMGDGGCLSLYGEKADTHRAFAEHLTAEYRVRTEGRNRVCDEWKQRPSRADNHFFDCLVGAAVAASIAGASLPEGGVQAPAKRRYVPLSEMKRRNGR